MAQIFADRVFQSSNTTGSGAYQLGQVMPGGYRAFSASPSIVDGDTVDVFVDEQDGREWEVGRFTYRANGTLERTLIMASSNNNQPVVWPPGTRRIALTFVAQSVDEVYSLALQAASNAAIVAAQTSVATAQAVLAIDAKTAAQLARDAAQLSSGTWPTTAAALGNGVAGVASLVAGTGGANGTFALAFSGGTQVVAPAGYFVVTGGAVMQVVVTYPGYYSAGTPTISFAASTGLTGASATAVMAVNVAAGKYFSVPSADTAEYLILYLNSAGTAVEQKRYPSTALIAPLLLTAPRGYAWAITDQDGRVALGVSDDGTTVAGKMAPVLFESSEIVITGSGMSLKTPAPFGHTWAIIDQDGRMAAGLTDGGTFRTSNLEATTLNGVSVQSLLTPDPASASLGAQNFGADINHVLSYGQSLSVGVATSSAITTTQRFDNLRFVGGVRRQDSAEPGSYASLVPLIETGPGEETSFETPIGGATDMIKERIASENGIVFTQHSYQMLGSAPGKGAQTIALLSKPGTLYTRFLNDVTFGLAAAVALNKSYKVPAFFWTQGESDPANTSYASQLSTLRNDISTDVRAITTQPEDVWCICYQLSRPFQALRFVEAQALDSKIRIAAPVYQLPKSDTTHFTALSSKIYGAYLGIAYKRLVIDGVDWKPTMPLTTLRQGKVIDVKFNRHGTGLVFDTTTIPIQPNFGFYLFDAANNPLTISSVTITKQDTVRMVAAATVPAGAKLRYGFTDPTAGTSAATPPKGNLRDNQGDTLVFDGGGINYPMHNWCLLFERTL